MRVVAKVCRPTMDLDPLLRAEMEGAGRPITFHDDLLGVLPEADVVYCSPTVIAELREDAVARRAAGELPLSRDLLEAVARDTVVVLHPLPRGEEVPTDVDATPYNGYFRQAANGVVLRMALLRLMLAGHAGRTVVRPLAGTSAASSSTGCTRPPGLTRGSSTRSR